VGNPDGTHPENGFHMGEKKKKKKKRVVDALLGPLIPSGPKRKKGERGLRASHPKRRPKKREVAKNFSMRPWGGGGGGKRSLSQETRREEKGESAPGWTRFYHPTVSREGGKGERKGRA